MTKENHSTPEPEESVEPKNKLEDCEIFKNEAAEYKDKYLRLLADMENTRKRMQKEKQELTQYSIERLLTEFLTPIDHMENALKFTQDQSDEVKHWALGFQMILNQFKDVLANNGVKAFESEGMSFDPYIHDAIEIVEGKEPGIIIKEYMKGYKMGERVIRPARVKVTQSAGQTEQP